ncbi:MAG: hypothetical protein Q8K72_15620, partial [Acidimicrobiales bacterium]|nr:hypothetical protein [Acidimicrobiales bacterium]
GLVFHLALAVDQTHQFYDFSSVMFALLVLFLPHSFGSWVGERVGSIRARLALRGPRLPVVARVVGVGVPVALVLVVIGDVTDARGSLLVGWWPWQVAGVLIVGAVIRYVRQRPPAYGSGWRIWPHHVAYLVVPLLLVGNGLTPYLELKTAFGWNMYSNLRTVGGESNHLLLGRSFPVLGEQDELVEIIRSSSADLESYAEAGYGLPYLQLRAYLADHPDESITYERGGERITLRRASDRPELVEPVPVWQRKFQVFRAVDLTSPERCVPVFGPAR